MTIRATATWLYHCTAEDDYFLPWEKVPEAIKDELEVNGGLPCDGSGHPGPWCEGCRFGASEEWAC